MDTHLATHFPHLAQAFIEMPERFPVETAERHGRLLSQLDKLWGTPEALDHLGRLLFADRADRQGFSPRIMTELMALHELHDIQYPQLNGSGGDAAQQHPNDDETQRAAAETKPGPGAAAGAAQDPVVGTAMPDSGADTPGAAAAPPATAEPRGAADMAPVVAAPRAWPTVNDVAAFMDILQRRGQGIAAPRRDTRKLLDILSRYCHIDPQAQAAALETHRNNDAKQPLGKILQDLGLVADEDVTRALCLQNGIPIVSLSSFDIAVDTMKIVPIAVARLKRAVPVAVIDNVLFIAVENPFAFSERQYLAFLTNHKVEVVMAARDEISARLADYGYARSAQQADQEFRFLAQKTLAPLDGDVASEEREDKEAAVSQDDATIVGLVNKMIMDAAVSGASDIHIERFPDHEAVQIRLRHDGRLETYSEYPAAYHHAVMSRIKIIAGLDITERRRAQDGKISFVRPDRRRLDLRVATLPTLRGIENAVIRLLHGGDPMPIDAMGMTERDLRVFRRLIQRPHGLLLVCGPTGSGKTTTLHSALRELNTPARKIWTAEDPVEIIQRNINQMQVNPKIGLTFANALRAFLRADPDVIMIGELRDAEATKIALEASMTGHLVLSTVHTNSASDTVARLLDLGADPFNLAGALLGVSAQRLARQLCPHCRVRQALKPLEVEDLAAEYFFSAHQQLPTALEREKIVAGWQRRSAKRGKLALWHGKGCEHCKGKGYKGRLAIMEVMETTPAIRHLVRTQQRADEILRTAIAGGMTTLKQDGIEKALAGKTCMTEVRGVCN